MRAWIRRLLARRQTAQAEKRWRRHNEEARRAGCRCGKPATHVRRCPVMGSVPSEIWTCADHVNVNGWTRHGADGPYEPVLGATFDGMEPWVGPPRRVGP